MGFDTDKVAPQELVALFMCAICQGLAEAPKQTPCVHTFCLACIDKWISSHNSCPVCRQAATPLTDLSDASLFLYETITVQCANVNRGCHAMSSPPAMSLHEDKCQKRVVECRKMCGASFCVSEKWAHRLVCPLETSIIFKAICCEKCWQEVSDPEDPRDPRTLTCCPVFDLATSIAAASMRQLGLQ